MSREAGGSGPGKPVVVWGSGVGSDPAQRGGESGVGPDVAWGGGGGSGVRPNDTGGGKEQGQTQFASIKHKSALSRWQIYWLTD